jgi:hypothetical protein
MATYYSPKISTSGLTLCLDTANPRSYSSGSDTWFDLTQNRHNFSLTGSIIYNSDGNGFLEISGSGSMTSINQLENYLTSSWSVSTWVNFRTFSSGSRSVVSINDPNYYLILGAVSASKQHCISPGRAIIQGMSGSLIFGTKNVHLDTWYNLVYSYNKTSDTSATASIYIDGALDTSGGCFLLDTLSSSSLKIGNFLSSSFDGYISKTSLYSPALAGEDVYKNYTKDVGRYKYYRPPTYGGELQRSSITNVNTPTGSFTLTKPYTEKFLVLVYDNAGSGDQTGAQAVSDTKGNYWFVGPGGYNSNAPGYWGMVVGRITSPLAVGDKVTIQYAATSSRSATGVFHRILNASRFDATTSAGGYMTSPTTTAGTRNYAPEVHVGILSSRGYPVMLTGSVDYSGYGFYSFSIYQQTTYTGSVVFKIAHGAGGSITYGAGFASFY